MNLYKNTSILYERGFKIGESLENKQLSPTNPSCYLDYDYRNKSINMGLPHYHLFYEMLLLLSPRCNHYVEGRKFSMKQGDIILLHPGVLHQSEYIDDNKNDRILIQFTWPGTMSFSDDRKKILTTFNAPVPVFRFEGEAESRLSSDLNVIVTDYLRTKGSAAQKILANAHLLEFLSDLYLYADQNVYFQSPDTGVRGKIYSIVNYIHIHYTEELSLHILAEKFFINPYYLSHCFKDMTGYTVGEYIQVTRIRNAQYLLDFSGQKITEIAETSGFTSFSQFNRSFWKVNGMSPSEYRRRQISRNTEVVDPVKIPSSRYRMP
ncbi:MAG: AraC family transcriptional regulator [Lachnospiraceae bacterium]|jgi:AraC-like DNA-binding protein|nr:AraC family transcriptional regulator [Lachnospiraceae bacterium]MCH4029884.1 AraC family transcriptional regulator [Lachnospiraceae bacterium]MCH4109401.1 AraC family transcriptional regulator [Lachnospiraceae bacterium]MCI1303051.1 AraC family transcriptional regulator [Lachnospiraceae bacterium]MCI1332359.1 AraC family transcriptional regulator [Lachnospiraceae bacterium]